MNVPLPEYLALLAWACAASAVAADRWWQCRRWHCGIAAGGEFVAWDESTATTTTAADGGRDTERAAS